MSVEFKVFLGALVSRRLGAEGPNERSMDC